MQNYTFTDTRGQPPAPRPTVRELRARVESAKRELAEWEYEQTILPGLLAQADARHGKHLGELRRLVGVDDANEVYIDCLIFNGQVDRATATLVQQARDRFRAEEMSDPRRRRSWLAARSAVVPREVDLARQAVVSAEHDLAAALRELEEGDR